MAEVLSKREFKFKGVRVGGSGAYEYSHTGADNWFGSDIEPTINVNCDNNIVNYHTYESYSGSFPIVENIGSQDIGIVVTGTYIGKKKTGFIDGNQVFPSPYWVEYLATAINNSDSVILKKFGAREDCSIFISEFVRIVKDYDMIALKIDNNIILKNLMTNYINSNITDTSNIKSSEELGVFAVVNNYSLPNTQGHSLQDFMLDLTICYNVI